MLTSHDITHGGKQQMSKAIEELEAAQRKAMPIRPKVGGFPYLACPVSDLDADQVQTATA